MPRNPVSPRANLGTRRLPPLRPANFPDADPIVRQGLLQRPRAEKAVDILLVNPPRQMVACG